MSRDFISALKDCSSVKFVPTILALGIGLGTQVSAAIITGVTATASSQFNANTPPSRTTDGSGLSSGQHDVAFVQHWFSSETTIPLAEEWIQFDLGAVYQVASVQVWNLNQNTGTIGNVSVNGINQLDIYVSSVANPGDPEGAGAANWTLLGANVNFAQAPGVNTYTGFDLATQTGATLPGGGFRWMRFEIDSAFDDSNQFEVGLSEVQFTAVPEPSSGILLLGLATVALARRRR
jgi:hypothetical protein